MALWPVLQLLFASFFVLLWSVVGDFALMWGNCKRSRHILPTRVWQVVGCKRAEALAMKANVVVDKPCLVLDNLHTKLDV